MTHNRIFYGQIMVMVKMNYKTLFKKLTATLNYLSHNLFWGQHDDKNICLSLLWKIELSTQKDI